MENELKALQSKKPRTIYVDKWSTDRIRDEKMIFCHGSVANAQDNDSRSVQRVPFVELTPELLAFLDSLYPEGFLKSQGG